MSLFFASFLDITTASLLDTFVLVACAGLLYKYARLTSAHPGFIYLIFHAMFFTARLYAIMSGAPTLFSAWPGALPVSQQEIAWAGLLSDLGLISITGGLILCSQRDRRRATRPFAAAHSAAALLSRSVIDWVSAVAFPIGITALLLTGAVPQAENLTVDFGEWRSSSWLMVTQFWPVLVLLALIYFYGFRWRLMVPTGIFLALMSVQGFNRFRVVLPVIFLLNTWQTRIGFKWPRKWMVVSFACLAILVFPMKRAGWMVRQGETLPDVVDVVTDSFSEVVRGTSPDQMFLDMFASTIWLVDVSGRYFYGTTIYPLVFLPIPRQLWPDKPGQVEYLWEIRNPKRPMYWAGMTPTLLGEDYANFGVIGIPAIQFVVGYWLGRFYYAAMRRPYFSVYRFMYLTVACSLIQIFRDGLFSAVVFPVVNMMPLTVIAVLSYVSFRRKRASNLLHSPFVPGRASGTTQA